MKNKEIEKILKYLKNNTYIPDETKRKYKILHRDEVNLLLSYIEQLEKVSNKRMDTILKIEKYCIDEKEDLIAGGEVCEDVLKFIDILKGDSDDE